MKINLSALQEDLRRLAIALFIAGLVRFMANNQVSINTEYAALGGWVFWILGLWEFSEGEVK